MNEEKIDLAFFKKHFPSLVSGDKLNLSLLRRCVGEANLIDEEHYELHWIGKKDAQTNAHTPPNTVILPAVHDLNTHTLHVLIEGENLETLKVLLPAYREAVKLIYIDPPYNTGNTTFVYQDTFAEQKYQYHRRTQQKQQPLKTKAHYHSAWLSMMYARLWVAKEFLRPDGVILLSIDDNEVANLKLIGDEIFGEDNFIGKFIWMNRTTPNDAARNFATDHEYILIFAKDSTKVRFKGVEKDLSNYKNPDNDKNGEWCADNPSAASGNERYKFVITNPHTGEEYLPPKGRFWAFSPKRVQEWTESGKLVFPKEKGKNFLLKKYKSELRSHRKPVSSVIANILTTHATKELKNLFQGANPFKFAKPTALIKFFIQQLTQDGDLILDFFAGSGTTTHATMLLNQEENTRRKSISIQLPEPYEAQEEQLNRCFNVVSDVLKARIDRVVAASDGNFSENFSYKWFSLRQVHAHFTPQEKEYCLLYQILLHKKFHLDIAIEKVFFQNSYYYQVGKKTAIVFQPIDMNLAVHWLERGIAELVIASSPLPDEYILAKFRQENVQLHVWK